MAGAGDGGEVNWLAVGGNNGVYKVLCMCMM